MWIQFLNTFCNVIDFSVCPHHRESCSGSNDEKKSGIIPSVLITENLAPVQMTKNNNVILFGITCFDVSMTCPIKKNRLIDRFNHNEVCVGYSAINIAISDP